MMRIIFYSCMGKEVLKYNGIKIFLTGECITPDLEICDYAMGIDHFQFGRTVFSPRFIEIHLEAF